MRKVFNSQVLTFRSLKYFSFEIFPVFKLCANMDRNGSNIRYLYAWLLFLWGLYWRMNRQQSRTWTKSGSLGSSLDRPASSSSRFRLAMAGWQPGSTHKAWGQRLMRTWDWKQSRGSLPRLCWFLRIRRIVIHRNSCWESSRIIICLNNC